MPTRKYVFTNHSFYHIYDKTIDHQRIFLDDYVSRYFLQVAHFYSYKIPSGMSFSQYRRMKKEDRLAFSSQYLNKKNRQIIFNVFVLMPNHYHFLIQQKYEYGVVKSMTRIMDSITRYYNIRNSRKGPIFLPHFNAVHVLTKQQLIYVSKYIHLNPLSAGISKSHSELLRFQFSSLPEYTNPANRLSWIDTNRILMHFDFSKEKYWKYLIGNRE